MAMEFSSEQLRILATKDEGWTALWHQLWEGLYERLHDMLINGVPNDPGTWSLNQKYRMLVDTARAQDFIAELLVDYQRRAELGSLLADFEGPPEKILVYLAAPRIIRGRALDFIARNNQVGITGMPAAADQGPRVRSIDAEEFDTHADPTDPELVPAGTLDTSRLPIAIAWNPGSGVNARVRMAALQCWPRLAPDQDGRDRLEADLRDQVHPDEPNDEIETLLEHHRLARGWIADRLDSIDREIQSAPGMHAPRRQDLDGLRVRLQAELLLEPLTREQVQQLLGLPSPEAAYQQLSRYRKAFGELFPALQERLERAGGVA